jgi:hypothetical protein
MPNRRTAVTGGAGALILAALGYRAWHRGALAGANGPAYAPWGDWAGRDTDGNLRPLRSAILAASPHNTQPWSFVASDDGITVYADRSRHLGTFDPFRREMHLGLGCAIENLVHAAEATGMTTEVVPESGTLNVSPGPNQVLAARIVVAAGHPGREGLLRSISKRHTNRGPYREEPVPPERLRQLAELATGPDLRLLLVSEDGARRELGAIIVDATERIVADPEMSVDNHRWIRTGRREILAHRDGLTLDTFGAHRLVTVAGKMLPDPGPGMLNRLWLNATREVHTATAPVFGVILVRDRLDMAQAIAAGRLWQRLHLAVTAAGLAAQPLNQPVEMMDRHRMLGRQDEFGPAFARLAGDAGWEPTFVFRVGYGKREVPPSPRRPLEDVVATTDHMGGRLSAPASGNRSHLPD